MSRVDLGSAVVTTFLIGLLVSIGAIWMVLGAAHSIAVKQQRQVVIDVAWGLGFVAVTMVAFGQSWGFGDPARRTLLLVLTTVWGLRLAAFLFWRTRGGGEDPRYAELMAQAQGDPGRYAIRRIWLPQAAVMLVVSLVQQVGMVVTGPLTWVAWAGVALWGCGLAFETVGDWQLARFRADPLRRGGVLDSGLWAWTRHPNYFGDAAAWWGMFLVTASAWPGVLTIVSPLLMTWILVGLTGKRLTESRIAGRPGYADYVARTSGFLPLPPRQGRAG